MGIPRSLRVLKGRTLGRQREVRPYPAQRASYKGRIHRLRANTGQRSVHDAHRHTECRNADRTA